MRKRVPIVWVIYAALVLGLMVFHSVPSRRAWAQDSGTPIATIDPYLGALGAQATANAQATRAAYQSRQSAAQAAQNAAALQAQAAAAQAQAQVQAQQATAAADQQHSQLIALQATADAAALQATAIVQQTRTALEVKATQTAVAIESDKQRGAVAATRSAVEAQDRDNRAVATSVAISLQATQQAIGVKAQSEAAQSESDQQTRETGNRVLIALVSVAGVLGLVLLWLVFKRLFRALNQPPLAPAVPMNTTGSSAASMVIDAGSGEMAQRMPGRLELEADTAQTRTLRRIFGDGHDA